MKNTTLQKIEAESFDMVPHADRTNDYNTEGTDPAVSNDEVSQVAYNRYVEQGSVHGHDVEHWIDAEVLLRAVHDKMLPRQADLAMKLVGLPTRRA
jgi:hypothetical protein